MIHSFFLLRFSSFSVSLISLDCHFKCLIFLVRFVSLNLLLCVYVNAVRSNCTQCSNCTNTINAARVQQLIIHGGDLWSADAHVKVSAILNVQWSTWRWAQLLFNTFWCTREGEHYFLHCLSTWRWAQFFTFFKSTWKRAQYFAFLVQVMVADNAEFVQFHVQS